jgi:hypothetical protein
MKDKGNKPKTLGIICDVMRDNVSRLNKDIDYVFIEQRLHDTPERMREELSRELEKVEDSYDTILIGYGLCSNGVVGLKSKKQKLVIPRVDDCISLFLGSKKKYLEEFKKDPATYYLCRGWIEYGGDPYRAYLVYTQQYNGIPREWFRGEERYGRHYDEVTARFIITEMMKNYNRVALIDNNDIEPRHREYALQMVNFLSELLCKEIEYREIKGSDRFISYLLDGNWQDGNFIVYEPGQEIKASDFMDEL